MEPLWSPVVATGGNRSQIAAARKRPNHAKPLPWIATSCRAERMVRRGALTRRAGEEDLLHHLAEPVPALFEHRRTLPQRSFVVGAGIAAVGIVAALTLIRRAALTTGSGWHHSAEPP
jgi:hypothetical protein